MATMICALMRQTWYETIKKNLEPGDRLRFYEMCYEFEFYGYEPTNDLPISCRIMFDMVRNDLIADRSRALAKAERARQNGALGGRPKITEENSEANNPEKPSRFFSEPRKPVIQLQNSTEQDSTEQRERDRENEDTHTFFSVCLDFFERGCSAPIDEAKTFWGYYESTGWKTKGGADIVDRIALAKAWRLKDCSRSLMRKRLDYAKMLRSIGAYEVVLIEDFVELHRYPDKKIVEITFETKTPALIMESKYLSKLGKWMPVDQDGNYYALEYKILQASIEEVDAMQVSD